MKTPSSLWRLILVSAVLATPAFGQSATPALTREPTFTTTYLKESEVDTHPRADASVRDSVLKITAKILGAQPELCAPGAYAVRIVFIVDTDGTTKEVQWVSTTNETYAAIEVAAVQHFRFSPALLNGRAVPCFRSVTVNLNRQAPTAVQPISFGGDPYSAQNLAAFAVKSMPDQSTEQTVAGSQIRQPAFSVDYLLPREVTERPRYDRDYNSQMTQATVLEYHENGLDPWRSGGMVRLAFVVDAKGTPTNVQWVETTNPGYAAFEVSAMSHYRYSPAMLNGRPVPCLQFLTISSN